MGVTRRAGPGNCVARARARWLTSSAVRPLTEPTIRSSFINCSKGDANRLTLPEGFDQIDWPTMVFLSWIDRKAPGRGYLITADEDGEPTGVLLRRPDSRVKSAVPQLCSLCLTTHLSSGVSLMVAPRSGPAGRNGNTVGTYICADLGCPWYLNGSRKPLLSQQLDRHLSLAEKMARTREKAAAFIASVRGE